MPRQTKDLTVTWTLDQDEKTWILAKGTFIDAASSTTGIDDTGNGSHIRVLGHVTAFSFGVQMGSASASLFIGEDAVVSSQDTGVILEFGGGMIVNHGTIEAGDRGIDGSNGMIKNFGTVVSELGINLSEGPFVIENAGEVTGTTNAINTSGAGKITNTNGGTVSGDTYGIFLGGAQFTTRVSNDGLIVGGGCGNLQREPAESQEHRHNHRRRRA